jgi:hypothetical protein
MNITMRLLLIVSLSSSLCGMQLTFDKDIKQTEGVHWQRDNFDNIWPCIQEIAPEQREQKLKAFIATLAPQEKGHAFLFKLPHKETISGAEFFHADEKESLWIIKNGSPIPQPKTAISGGRVAVLREGKILVIEDKNIKGKIMLPGGSADDCELARDAAARELKEEVGLTVDQMQLKLLDL